MNNGWDQVRAKWPMSLWCNTWTEAKPYVGKCFAALWLLDYVSDSFHNSASDPGTRGSSRTAVERAEVRRQLKPYPLAPFSGAGAALFISWHTHTHKHTSAQTGTHTLGLWECMRPQAQTLHTPVSITALVCHCKHNLIIRQEQVEGWRRFPTGSTGWKSGIVHPRRRILVKTIEQKTYWPG